ncbi:signal recognition particle subunit srp68 [Mycoemilia scoparia]|uniref:Signal recognition particle subunit SRP68 n=1 Tax=Mycoemilia scoparia TaxID=417184 RepID=A0A9W7ZTJ8_9FUNG|nr:signal recognition particle subunit srp68 [Mycoemilia scoparia]
MALLRFNVLEYVYKNRQEYGVRNKDYIAYRRFCKNHLHQVRKTIGNLQGTSKKYQQKSIVSIDDDKNDTEHKLKQSERAWAFSMELKELYYRTEEPRQRYHLVRRLKVAINTIKSLLEVVKSSSGEILVDDFTYLSILAYLFNFKALLAFEQEEWEPALNNSVASRIFCERLAQIEPQKLAAAFKSTSEALDQLVYLSAYQSRLIPEVQGKRAEDIAKSWYAESAKTRFSTNVFENFEGLQTKLDNLVNSSIYDSAGAGKDSSKFRGSADSEDVKLTIPWGAQTIAVRDQHLASYLQDALKSLESLPAPNNLAKLESRLDISKEFEQSISQWKRVIGYSALCVSKKESEIKNTEYRLPSDGLNKEILELRYTHGYATFVFYSLCATSYIYEAQWIEENNNISSSGSKNDIAKAFRIDFQKYWNIDPQSLDNNATLKAVRKLATPPPKNASALNKGLDVLPEFLRIAVLYQLAVQQLSILNKYFAKVKQTLSALKVKSIIDVDKLCKDLYISRGWLLSHKYYYLAAAHVQPEHRAPARALAILQQGKLQKLLDILPTDSHPDSVTANGLWDVRSQITKHSVDKFKKQITQATTITQSILVQGGRSNPGSWIEDPASYPTFIYNPQLKSRSKRQSKKPKQKKKKKQSSDKKKPAGSGVDDEKVSLSVPKLVPNLVDISGLPQYSVIAAKPIYYDLAAKYIDFDFDAIEERAAKAAPKGKPQDQGLGGAAASKIGSIISGFWNRGQ